MIKCRGIALEKVLKMNLMKDCNIISGHDASDNVIACVKIMADPDILNWATEGDFILTTAFFFKNASVDEQRKFIFESARKKLSGIGIKIYPYLEKLPDEIILLADELKLPIVELNNEISFRDITTISFNQESQKLQKLEKVYNDAMGAILKGVGIKGIIRVLMQTVENPILVRYYFSEEYVYDDKDILEDYDALIDCDNKHFKTTSSYHRFVKKIEDRIYLNNEYVDRISVPIITRNKFHGYMLMLGTHRKISKFDVLALELVSSVIALEYLN